MLAHPEPRVVTFKPSTIGSPVNLSDELLNSGIL